MTNAQIHCQELFTELTKMETRWETNARDDSALFKMISDFLYFTTDMSHFIHFFQYDCYPQKIQNILDLK